MYCSIYVHMRPSGYKSVNFFISDFTRIVFKVEDVEVVENTDLAEVCLMLNRPTSTALNVDVTSIDSGSVTGEN